MNVRHRELRRSAHDDVAPVVLPLDHGARTHAQSLSYLGWYRYLALRRKFRMRQCHGVSIARITGVSNRALSWTPGPLSDHGSIDWTDGLCSERAASDLDRTYRSRVREPPSEPNRERTAAGQLIERLVAVLRMGGDQQRHVVRA
jgi:hypothetical protein